MNYEMFSLYRVFFIIMRTFLSNKKFISGSVLAGLLVGWVAFGFFGVHTAFIDNEVNESNPFATIETLPVPAGQPVGHSEQSLVTSTMPSTTLQSEATTSAPERLLPTTSVPPPTTTSSIPVETLFPVGTIAESQFSSSNNYSVNGSASIISDGTQRVLRFENFESDNGPDLNVYLRSATGEIIDLGDLKGNIGDQNYFLGNEINLDIFNEVVIWCVRFNAEFGFAEL